ncbi:MAG: bifunctional heptose 7-phosphate kinase/heptose 1-phosphate adenyltransferase [Phycisphaerales bacterium]|nr:bifunctional heptose 7-phosphate kinase/heptose 1-phosphate adenyltransferase [Planctomycetota bacterium]MBL6998124.1 bifunctional heptose 7-phosphate kinase/heptose 1-phosphate adenyltransferase [Phycisphaerales bacterium]
MSDLLTKVLQIQRPSILVIGDLMLDETVSGDAERLSPDSPVPVLEVRSVQSRLGGAANVARCLVAMNASVECLGVVGNDKEGELLIQLLASEGIDSSNILRVEDRPTTVKRSIVGLAQHRHPQKMFRVDHESREPLKSEHAEVLISKLNEIINKFDVVCIEDYGKGVVAEAICVRIIEHCKDAGVEVIVDPAGIEDYSKYAGATAITPNRTEAEKATGSRLDDANPLEGAATLATTMCESLHMHAAVVTLDRHGAVLKENGQKAIHVPTRARSVYDVTGAGDIVLAAIAVGRGGRLDWKECVELANVAAGLEVEKFGATPIPMSQIHKELLSMQADCNGKIRSSEDLAIEIAAAKEIGQRVVLTNGCFDVIHAGHVSYLREAAKLGDILIVGVNSDEQVALQKGEGRPIYTADERMDILAELQCVSYIIQFEEPTASELIKSVCPDLYVKGGDYVPEEINEYNLLKELGIEIQLLSERPGRSSTDVVSQLKETR